MHTQLDLIRYSFERHFELPHTAVLNSILESFLQDAEETQCNFLRQSFRNILGVKIDLDILLPRKLSAKALGRRYESQVFQFRRVQTVGQGLDIVPEIRNEFTGLSHATASFALRSRTILFQALQIHRQQSDALIDIVVQFSGNPGTFLLVGLNQRANHAGKGLFSLFTLTDVNSRADVARKGSVSVESRHSLIENPAIFCVFSAEPILHPERLPPIERLCIGLKATFQVVSVDSLCPAISQFLVQGPTGELQPSLIEIGTEPVRAGHPDHYRCGISDQTEALFAFAQRCFCQLAESNISSNLGGADDLASPV